MDKPQAGRDVLVVDDDEAIRETVRTILEEAGYTVYEAPDGEPALQRLRKHPQGMVVLLDLNMPGMDGFAVLHALADDPDLAQRHAIIVFTSLYAHGLPLPDAEFLVQHHVALLIKPFEVDGLVRTVAGAASRVQ